MVQIVLAGRLVPDAGRAVVDYLTRYHGTVSHYDKTAYEAGKDLTPALIKMTQQPWMGSRISGQAAAELVSRTLTAPWSAVPVDSALADADPAVDDGLYDAAGLLWSHFAHPTVKGAKIAALSKVLHLMRPHLVPILDSRLLGLYSDAAFASARQVPGQLGRWDYWAAIRSDIVGHRAELTGIRDVVRSSDAPEAAWAADALSDVRILDMLSWSLGTA